MYQLKPETPDDWWEIEALFDLCFAPGREALPSYRLRVGVRPISELCLILRDSDGILSAAIRFWPVCVGRLPTLLLGPIAVHPTRQGEGLGQTLVAASLNKATTLNWSRVLLVGDAVYYEKFGFRQLKDVQMPPPTNPERVLGRALVTDAWLGVTGEVTKIS